MALKKIQEITGIQYLSPKIKNSTDELQQHLHTINDILYNYNQKYSFLYYLNNLYNELCNEFKIIASLDIPNTNTNINSTKYAPNTNSKYIHTNRLPNSNNSNSNNTPYNNAYGKKQEILSLGRTICTNILQYKNNKNNHIPNPNTDTLPIQETLSYYMKLFMLLKNVPINNWNNNNLFNAINLIEQYNTLFNNLLPDYTNTVIANNQSLSNKYNNLLTANNQLLNMINTYIDNYTQSHTIQ